MSNTQVDPPQRPEFVKVANGEVSERGLPETGELPDGRQVSGFDKLPDADLKQLGWTPVQDPGEPVHDPDTQVVQQDLVVAPTGEVSAVYTVVDLPSPAPVQASTEDQLTALFALLVAKGTITQAEVDQAKVLKQ